MSFFPVTTRYPAGPITPAGACWLLKGTLPHVTYRSYNDAVVFNLLGPLAIWDRTIPERIVLEDVDGLIPPWRNIRQKGATQDGSTWITSLYDPMEAGLTVKAHGRPGQPTRKVIRDWIDSWDAKKPGTLSWFTPEQGYWWAKMRWEKPPLDKIMGGLFNRQKFKMVVSCDDAFWRTYDTTSVFAISYLSAVDNFATAYSPGLGPNWSIGYNTAGTGYLYSDGAQCTSTLHGGRSAAARWHIQAGSDEQVVTFTIGPVDPWPAATDVYLDLWARMDNSGAPGQTGIRCRLGYRTESTGGKHTTTANNPYIRLSYFISGTETVLRETDVTVPWQPTDQISLAVGGYAGTDYSYKVQRGTNTNLAHQNTTWQTLMTVVHAQPDGSHIGSSYRGIGFGMQANGTNLPPSIKLFTGGDNQAVVNQDSGYVTLFNQGDQDMWPYFILVGPGTFGLGDGPNATQAVTYGPLLENQMVLIRTDPRRYSVTDLTSMPPPGTPATTQALSALESAIEEFFSFMSNASMQAPQLSAFGTPFPQGNPYSLLKGRFSRPIPAKPPGSPAPPQQIAVAFKDGTHSTAILAGGTPLRRYPG